MTNPNPSFISDAMWNLWLVCEQIIPGVRLGGIYANKSGYHNTVNHNKKSWPGNYSIQLPLDLTEPDNKARAIDLTMDDAQMRLRTEYLRASALDPVDDRLECVREFYGTLNGTVVFGLIKDNEDGPWRSATSDSSHLWHIHISIFTSFVELLDILLAVASVLSGQTYAEWKQLEKTMKGTLMKCDDGSVWLVDAEFQTVSEILGDFTDQQVRDHRNFWRRAAGREDSLEDWLTDPDTGQVKVLTREWLQSGIFGADITRRRTAGGGGSVSGPVDLTEEAIDAVAVAVVNEEGRRLAVE